MAKCADCARDPCLCGSDWGSFLGLLFTTKGGLITCLVTGVCIWLMFGGARSLQGVIDSAAEGVVDRMASSPETSGRDPLVTPRALQQDTSTPSQLSDTPGSNPEASGSPPKRHDSGPSLLTAPESPPLPPAIDLFEDALRSVDLELAFAKRSRLMAHTHDHYIRMARSQIDLARARAANSVQRARCDAMLESADRELIEGKLYNAQDILGRARRVSSAEHNAPAKRIHLLREAKEVLGQAQIAARTELDLAKIRGLVDEVDSQLAAAAYNPTKMIGPGFTTLHEPTEWTFVGSAVGQIEVEWRVLPKSESAAQSTGSNRVMQFRARCLGVQPYQYCRVIVRWVGVWVDGTFTGDRNPDAESSLIGREWSEVKSVDLPKRKRIESITVERGPDPP